MPTPTDCTLKAVRGKVRSACRWLATQNRPLSTSSTPMLRTVASSLPTRFLLSRPCWLAMPDAMRWLSDTWIWA